MTRAERIRATAADIGDLTARKNEAYGASFATAGDALRLLAPDGLRPDQYGAALLVARIWDKRGRLVSDPSAFGEDPLRDIAGYGLVGTVDALERREASNAVAAATKGGPR
jgi:hypothetical protein